MPVYLPTVGFLDDDSQYFRKLRDGMPPGEAPHVKALKHSCKVKLDFYLEEEKIQFRAGMQGSLIKSEGANALIFIESITPRDIWVPMDYIEVGQVLSKFKDWDPEANLAPGTLKLHGNVSSGGNEERTAEEKDAATEAVDKGEIVENDGLEEGVLKED